MSAPLSDGPHSGGPSTCGMMWESAPQAERPERRMGHQSAALRDAVKAQAPTVPAHLLATKLRPLDHHQLDGDHMTHAEAGRLGGRTNKGRNKGWQSHTAARRARVKALMDQGMSLTPIADALGMSIDTARNDLRAIRMAK